MAFLKDEFSEPLMSLMSTLRLSPGSFWRRLSMVLPLLVAVSCSDATGVESHVGFYDMTQFAGGALPSGDGEIFIRSAVLELRSGGTFRLQMDRDRFGELDPVVEVGNYAVSGTSLTLYTDPSPLTGAIFPTYIHLNDNTNDPSKPSIWVKRAEVID